MRILHCCPHLIGGGAERQLRYLARYWAERGWDVHIACLVGTKIPGELRIRGITIHELERFTNYDPMLIWRLINVIRLVKPQIVQTWLLQMDVFGGVAAALLRQPWILREPINRDFWAGGGMRDVYKLAAPRTLLRRWVATRTASAIVSNSAGGNDYWSTFVPPERRFLIPNALPLDEVKATRALSLPTIGVTGGPVLVAAGRLEAQKNFSVLLNAFQRVLKTCSVELVIAGQGSKRIELEAQAAEFGILNQVHFTGHLESIWPLLKAADGFISLSQYEGLPNTVLEAMACGCPLILSNIAAHRELHDADSALLVDQYEDPEVVASAILKLLHTPSLAKRLATVAAQRARQYSVEKTAEAYERMYKKFLT